MNKHKAFSKLLASLLALSMMFTITPITARAATEDYHTGDVAVINAIIENNGLSASKNDPDTWDFIEWDEGIPKRVIELDLSYNILCGELDVSGLTMLTVLNCALNELTALDVSGLVMLTELDCTANALTALDVSNNTALEYLYCSDNRLTSLDLSGLYELTGLTCSENHLTSLDVSDNTKLEQLHCQYNDMPLPESGFEERVAPGITGMEHVVWFNTENGYGLLPVWPSYIAEGNDPFYYYPQNTIFDVADIAGVTPPVAGEEPVTEIGDPDVDICTGTVSWSPYVSSTFEHGTVYTATITLAFTQSAGWGHTFFGVPANFFTVGGSSSVSNAANSGVITAVFPETESSGGGELSDDAALKSLDVSTGTLTPVFDADTTSYIVTVGYDVSSILITAAANSVKASVSGTGTKTLNVGENTFNIVVTAENGTTKIYTITITREAQTTYPLTVLNGTGTGNYIEGAVVAVAADAAEEGMEFKEWSITPAVTFTNGTSKLSPTAQFAMPAGEVTATAVYEDITNYISTAEELAAIGGAASEGKYYALTGNIVLTQEWTPIDDFRGTFDGRGFSVDNLNIRESSNRQYAGLFGLITASDVAIKNTIVNIGSQGVVAVSQTEQAYAGGLIGFAYSQDLTTNLNITVKNCFVTGDVRALRGGFAGTHAGGLIGGLDSGSEYRNVGTVTDCHANGGSISASSGTGGLIGTIRGEFILSDSDSTNSVYFVGGAAGGLIGSMSGVSFSIRNCHATGDVTAHHLNWSLCHTNQSTEYKMVEGSGGGLIGSLSSSGDMFGCYATGDVSVTAFLEEGVNRDPLPGGTAGGLVGYNYVGSFSYNQCYATGNVSYSAMSDARIGGFIGTTSGSVSALDCYARGNVYAWGSRNVYAGGFSCYDIIAENCYATGTVTGHNTGVNPAYVGGFFGKHPFVPESPINCYRLNTTVTGGISGEINQIAATALTLSEMRNAASFSDWDFNTVWDIHSNQNNGFPYLRILGGGAGVPIYTVVFDLNGGTRTGGGELTQQLLAGGSAAAPTVARSNYTFTGWDTSFEAVTQNITVTAKWSYNNPDTGNHTNDSGGGPTESADTGTTEINGGSIPITQDNATGEVTAKLSVEDVEKALEKAAETGEIVITIPDVVSIDESTPISINISSGAIAAIAESGASLTIEAPSVIMIFDADAIGTIAGAAGEVTISAKLADTDGLTAEQQESIGDRPVYEFSAMVNGASIHELGGRVTISIPYTPQANEGANAVIIYYIDASGNLQLIPNGIYDAITGTITFITDHFSLFMIGYNAVSFNDVSSGHWAKDYITFIAAREIFSGIGDGQFSPDGSMTRAMFAVALANLGDADLSGYTVSRFGDVSLGQWYTAAIGWAADMDIVSGTGGGNFDPDAPITREQMAVMLYNYMKYKGIEIPASTNDTFADEGSISAWALEAIMAIRNMGIVSGKPGNLYDPQATATRAEVATIFARFVEYIADGK